jgi:uncharacterized protein with PIN domain
VPKFKCKCSSILRYSDIPCDIEYKFISDVDYDNYQGSVNVEELYMKMESFIKCPNCQRLWVFWLGFQNEPTEYVKAE